MARNNIWYLDDEQNPDAMTSVHLWSKSEKQLKKSISNTKTTDGA